MSPQIVWRRQQTVPRLGAAEAHVWAIDLRAARGAAEALAQHLSPDELRRASRFSAASDRNGFIAARGTLRVLLGAYLGVDPGAPRFRYTATGRPSLEYPPEQGLHFNVSHSGDIAVLGFGRGRIGVDVELIRPMPKAAAVARRVFPAADLERFLADAPPREISFFRHWTRLEARVKALGASVWNGPDIERAAPGLAVCDLDPSPGYAAAAAVEDGYSVRTFARL